MTMQQPIFDPVKFKDTTRKQWDSAAEAWNRWGPLLTRWLGPATELMLDMTDIGKGSRVLDVAAGAGEETLTAARRVGPTGYVLATDISPGILDFAASNAKLAGHANVDTVVADGEMLDAISAQPFDAVISRVGLIYFPDQNRALGGCAIISSRAARLAPSSIPPPTRTCSSRSRSASSAAAPPCPRLYPASPDRSAWATRRCLPGA
ncbi:class I SAM-dependent methyltransferase [Mesorhizobium sp. Root695]|uniref:class I SAM-dependent methyltransferase n=1 Tax=Mesorhizobium sp. Root695 TaxID=1736589 RepID=UPI000B207B37|nr:class I SAM-dependent methyltransferase [Mesorhizobium sp. Root695]